MSGPALIFDTETTSLEPDREVIEAAWIRPPAVADLAGASDRIPLPLSGPSYEGFVQRYKPTKPSTFGSMAVHHILPEELEDCPPPSDFKLPNGIARVEAKWNAAPEPATAECSDDEIPF